MKISFEMTLHLVLLEIFFVSILRLRLNLVGKVTVGHPVITDSFRHIKSARIFFFKNGHYEETTLICSSRTHLKFLPENYIDETRGDFSEE